jgi:UDP-N-acetylglucosamine--N-acetylmuramyl-(pentapeptide) pyrophosphoryl-undecaprenol N-acetylglucosamine transferase
MGGSQGAQRINDALREILPNLLETFNVVHLTGRGKQIDFHASGYKGFEFVGPELKDIFAASSLVVSRAGANSIFELLALKKPMLLIPLEIGSRGDQILNAKSFVTNGWAASLSESDLSPGVLSAAIMGVHTNAANIRAKQAELSLRDVPRSVVAILLTEANLG